MNAPIAAEEISAAPPAPPAGPGEDIMALLEKLVALLSAGGAPGAEVSRNQEVGQLTSEGGGLPPQANPTVGAPSGPMDQLTALLAKLKGGA